MTCKLTECIEWIAQQTSQDGEREAACVSMVCNIWDLKFQTVQTSVTNRRYEINKDYAF